MGLYSIESCYINHAVDLLFLQQVQKRVDTNSLCNYFEAWFDRTYDQSTLCVRSEVDATAGDKFLALLIVFALAFTCYDETTKFDDLTLLLNEISTNQDLASVWPIVPIILFGSVEGIVSTSIVYGIALFYSHVLFAVTETAGCRSVEATSVFQCSENG